MIKKMILRLSCFCLGFFTLIIVSFYALYQLFGPLPGLRAYSGAPPIFNYNTIFGTGFYIDRNGDVLTDRHVVKNCEKITLSGYGFKNREIEKVVFPKDSGIDLAIISTGRVYADKLSLSHEEWPLPYKNVKISSETIGKNLRSIGSNEHRAGLVLGYPGWKAAEYPSHDIVVLPPSATTSDLSHWLLIAKGIFRSGESGSPVLDASGKVVGALSSIQKNLDGNSGNDLEWVQNSDGELTGNTGLYTPAAVIRDFADTIGINLTDRSTSDLSRAVVRIYCFEKPW